MKGVFTPFGKALLRLLESLVLILKKYNILFESQIFHTGGGGGVQLFLLHVHVAITESITDPKWKIDQLLKKIN